MNKGKGKLDTIYQHHIIQDYLNESNIVYGYLGHENRTDETDMFLEKLLTQKTGEAYYSFGIGSISLWICSRTMDDCYNEEYFKANVMGNIMDS